MENVFFLHQAKHNKTNDTWDKGIVVKSAAGAKNFELAKQGYHAYLGAYAYGQSADTDFVQCYVTGLDGAVLLSETWTAEAETEPAE